MAPSVTKVCPPFRVTHKHNNKKVSLSNWCCVALFSVCGEGHYGPNCELECQCENGGKCEPSTGACECPAGFIGPRCNICESIYTSEMASVETWSECALCLCGDSVPSWALRPRLHPDGAVQGWSHEWPSHWSVFVQLRKHRRGLWTRWANKILFVFFIFFLPHHSLLCLIGACFRPQAALRAGLVQIAPYAVTAVMEECVTLKLATAPVVWGGLVLTATQVMTFTCICSTLSIRRAVALIWWLFCVKSLISLSVCLVLFQPVLRVDLVPTVSWNATVKIMALVTEWWGHVSVVRATTDICVNTVGVNRHLHEKKHDGIYEDKWLVFCCLI